MKKKKNERPSVIFENFREKLGTLNGLDPQTYIQEINDNQETDRQKKINKEKRKRLQIYTTLDYLISVITYFDFFSLDAFEISLCSKYVADIANEAYVSPTYLLLSFLTPSCDLYSLLKIYNITFETVINKGESLEFKFWDLSALFKDISNFSIFTFVDEMERSIEDFFDDCFKFLGIPFSLGDYRWKDEEESEYSNEVMTIFEKATENAKYRFKTPVVTSEILFITLMEDNKEETGKLIRKIIQDETNFYLLRFKLLKILHKEETYIRTDIKINYRYFAYLLKTQLPYLEYSRLCENEYHELGVLYFRNILVQEVLKIDFLSLLKEEVESSIEYGPKRSYTYPKIYKKWAKNLIK
jgi:hypothetical protein